LRGGVFQMPITLQQSEIIASEFRDIKGKWILHWRNQFSELWNHSLRMSLNIGNEQTNKNTPIFSCWSKQSPYSRFWELSKYNACTWTASASSNFPIFHEFISAMGKNIV
jgi:hypothetical protein